MDLAVHRLLADPARDELGVLRTEIEDDDQLMHVALSLARAIRSRYSTR